MKAKINDIIVEGNPQEIVLLLKKLKRDEESNTDKDKLRVQKQKQIVATKGRIWTKVEKNLLKKLYGEGKSILEMTEYFPTRNRNAVASALYRYGLSIKKRDTKISNAELKRRKKLSYMRRASNLQAKELSKRNNISYEKALKIVRQTRDYSEEKRNNLPDSFLEAIKDLYSGRISVLRYEDMKVLGIAHKDSSIENLFFQAILIASELDQAYGDGSQTLIKENYCLKVK